MHDAKSKSSLNDQRKYFLTTPIEKLSDKINNNNNNNNSNLQKIKTEKNSEINKRDNNIDKNENLKGIHLNQEEKDSFFGVLGYLQNNLINYIRQYKLISVEKFYGIFNFIKKLRIKVKIKLKKMMKL